MAKTMTLEPKRVAAVRRRLNVGWKAAIQAGLLDENKAGAARLTSKGMAVYLVLDAHVNLNIKAGNLRRGKPR